MRTRGNPKTAHAKNDIALDTAQVLILDCQTSGSHARTGQIIEIGWVVCGGGHHEKCRERIETFLVQLPDGLSLSKRVQQVTGITGDALDTGITPRAAWEKIQRAARDTARNNGSQTCPTIVHYAKFEEPFLHELHGRYSPQRPFPLEIICTHEISRRLFPALPRRGIRALAGFFGHGIRNRRCHDHVAATVVIWRELIELLRKKYKVSTIAELRHWLARTPIHVHVYHSYPMERKKRRYLPDRPGVYRMLRSNGDILYIGKAGSIRKRVNSYFTKSNHHADHILEMLTQAKQIDVTETESALEAAILESDEIKQQLPPYNRALQATERVVWFCTPDLKEFGPSPNARLTKGPFIRRAAIESLAAIRDMLKISACTWNEETALHACAVPEKYVPDIECVRAGCELFLQQNAGAFQSESVEHALASLGRQFWSQYTTDRETDDDNNDIHDHDPAHKWTPETVARIITANVRAGTHMLRRAAWLVWLTESVFAWEEVRNSKKHRYLLVFERGEIVHRQHIVNREDIGIPPGYKKRFRVRQRCFNLATFDRMRVLLTEMRTVLNGGHWLAVGLGPKTILERSILEGILKWV